MLLDAIDVYTRPAPRGCLVVTAATNIATERHQLQAWLADHRRHRTQSIIDRLRQAAVDGELVTGADVATLGQALATYLNGLSTQARDAVSRTQLRRTVPTALGMLDAHLSAPSQPV